jgi:hypothetical protein
MAKAKQREAGMMAITGGQGIGKTYQNNLGGLRQADNYPQIQGESFYPEY